MSVKVSSGGKDGGEDDHDHGLVKSRGEVLAWLDEEQEWVEEGKMKMARFSHAVTTIMLDDPAMDFRG